jgi:hypothetical protein
MRLYDTEVWKDAKAEEVFDAMRVREGEAIDRHRLNRVLADWSLVGRDLIKQLWFLNDLLTAKKALLTRREEVMHVQMRQAMLVKGDKPTYITAKLINGNIRLDPAMGPELEKLEEEVREMEMDTGYFDDACQIFRNNRDMLSQLSNNLRAEIPSKNIEKDTQKYADEVDGIARRVRKAVKED